MISAVKILMPSSSAKSLASGVTLTSKASKVANSLCCLAPPAFVDLTHLRISFLCTGPMLTELTGIFCWYKNSSSASSEPIVDACTLTPSAVLSTYFSRMSIKSSEMHYFASFISSSLLHLNNSEPAMASSISGALILIPIAPLIF